MIKAQPGGGTPRELTPSGSHVAICYEIMHVGTVMEAYMGEDKLINKIRITWELPNEMRTFSEEKGEQPMVISQEYTLSMHEKSNLRKNIESWRGQKFTEQEADDFDISKLLGVPCMLSIVHTTSKKGKDYANVSNVSGVPKGMTVPKQINPSVEFNYDDKFDIDFIESLPDFLKDKIKSSLEYTKRILELEAEEEAKKKSVAMNTEMDNAMKKDFAEKEVARKEGNDPVDDLPF